MSKIDIGKLTQDLLDEIKIKGVVRQVAYYNPLGENPAVPENYIALATPRSIPEFEIKGSHSRLVYVNLSQEDTMYDIFFELNRKMTKIDRYFIVKRTKVQNGDKKQLIDSGRVLNFGFGIDKDWGAANVLTNFLYESRAASKLNMLREYKLEKIPEYLNNK